MGAPSGRKANQMIGNRILTTDEMTRIVMESFNKYITPHIQNATPEELDELSEAMAQMFGFYGSKSHD